MMRIDTRESTYGELYCDLGALRAAGIRPDPEVLLTADHRQLRSQTGLEWHDRLARAWQDAGRPAVVFLPGVPRSAEVLLEEAHRRTRENLATARRIAAADEPAAAHMGAGLAGFAVLPSPQDLDLSTLDLADEPPEPLGPNG